MERGCCVQKKCQAAKTRRKSGCLRATPAISHSTCLSKKKKSGAPTGVVPTKVRTRWCRIEEPPSPEERKAGRRIGDGQGFAAASHLYLHPNSFQVAVRFLENQSPRSALPRSFLSFPLSASRPPECRCARLSEPGRHLSKFTLWSAFPGTQCPSSSSLPLSPGCLPPPPNQMLSYPPFPAPPPRAGESLPGKPQHHSARSLPQPPPDLTKGEVGGREAGLELKVKTPGRCRRGAESPSEDDAGLGGSLGQLTGRPLLPAAHPAGAGGPEGHGGWGGTLKTAQEARRAPRGPRPVPAGGPWGRSGMRGGTRNPTCPAGRSSWWCGSCGLCSRPCRRSRAPPPSPPAGAAPAGASSRARPALPHAAPGRHGGPPAQRLRPVPLGSGGRRGTMVGVVGREGGARGLGAPSEGRPGWRRCPCGPAAPARRLPLLPPPASHAAMCARSGAVRAWVRARPAGQSEPSAAAACPPPRREAPCSLHAAAAASRSPKPSAVPALPPPFSARLVCDSCLRQVRLGPCR